MRRGPRKRAQEDPTISARINHQIKAPELRLLDEAGELLGVFPLSEALKMAKEAGLDLVETVSQANPPIARIIGYDKFRYHETKKIKKQRVVTAKTRKSMASKRVQISIRSAQNDLETRARLANQFLKDGNQVEIMVNLRGREKGNKDFAKQKLLEFVSTMITEKHQIISHPKPGGRGITMMITPR